MPEGPSTEPFLARQRLAADAIRRIYTEAIEHFIAVLKLHPGDRSAEDNLAVARRNPFPASAFISYRSIHKPKIVKGADNQRKADQRFKLRCPAQFELDQQRPGSTSNSDTQRFV